MSPSDTRKERAVTNYYDSLTTAQRRVWNKEHNRLDDIRANAVEIPYDAYKEVRDKAIVIVTPEIEAIDKAHKQAVSLLEEKVNELKAQIQAREEERDALIRDLRNKQNDMAKTEFEAYNRAWAEGMAWFQKKWNARKVELLTEWGYIKTEEVETVEA